MGEIYFCLSILKSQKFVIRQKFLPKIKNQNSNTHLYHISHLILSIIMPKISKDLLNYKASHSNPPSLMRKVKKIRKWKKVPFFSLSPLLRLGGYYETPCMYKTEADGRQDDRAIDRNRAVEQWIS